MTPNQSEDGVATQPTLPEFPLFEMDDAEAAFGCSIGRYIPRDQCDPLRRQLRPLEEVVSALFFNGGSLAQHGLCWKNGIESKKAMRALSGLLRSFAPAHEQKTTTAALALHHWSEKIPAEPLKATQP